MLPRTHQEIRWKLLLTVHSSVFLNSLMEKVERLQYQVALAITGAWNGSSRTKLYEELGWE